MFASITCPACRHRFIVPEAAMGSRQTCPNCRTPFLAGKSVPEAATADVPMKHEPAAAAAPGGINKTMLGETEPPVRYNCPRCKKPLESPAIEAGTKKPCPSCGQRLQVPAPPPPTPGLNKTMLVTSDANPPTTGVTATAPMPSAAPPPAATIVPAPATGGPFSRRLAIIGGGIASAVFALLCMCLIAAAFSGPSAAEREKLAALQKQFADAQKQNEELKLLIPKMLRDLEDKEREAKQQQKFDLLLAQYKTQQDELNRQAERDRQAYLNDQQKLNEAKREQERRQRDLEDAKLKVLREKNQADADMKSQLAKLQSDLEVEKRRQQQVQTIVSQPPPVVYSYPYYHPHHWSPWGW